MSQFKKFSLRPKIRAQNPTKLKLFRFLIILALTSPNVPVGEHRTNCFPESPIRIPPSPDRVPVRSDQPDHRWKGWMRHHCWYVEFLLTCRRWRRMLATLSGMTLKRKKLAENRRSKERFFQCKMLLDLLSRFGCTFPALSAIEIFKRWLTEE